MFATCFYSHFIFTLFLPRSPILSLYVLYIYIYIFFPEGSEITNVMRGSKYLPSQSFYVPGDRIGLQHLLGVTIHHLRGLDIDPRIFCLRVKNAIIVLSRYSHLLSYVNFATSNPSIITEIEVH